MLGFAPLAAAPLGAAGTGGVAYDVAFSDAAVVAETALQASPIYLVLLAGAAVGSDATRVANSTFNAATSGAAAGDMTAAAVPTFLANLSGAVSGADSVSAAATFVTGVYVVAFGTASDRVAASTFNAAASDLAEVDDSARALASMIVSFAGGAFITDSDAAGFLWNVINDSQTAAWGTVNTSQAASSWGTIGTGQSSDWTPVKTQA